MCIQYVVLENRDVCAVWSSERGGGSGQCITRDMLEVCAASDKMHTWLDLSTSIALQSDM